MAVGDEAAVKREEFLAVLKTMEPVPPGEEGPAGDDSDEERNQPSESNQGNRDTVMADIAQGVKAAAAESGNDDTNEPGEGAAKTGSSRGKAGSGSVTRVDLGVVEIGSEAMAAAGPLDGPTFEDMIRDVLAKELRRWVDENLEEVTARVVREEIRMMGRRRQAPGE